MCYLYKKAKIGINNIRQFNYEPFDRIDLYNNRYPKDNNYYVEKLQTSLDKGTQRKTTENELPSLTQCTA